MERKLAVWMSQHKLGLTVAQGLRMISALKKSECTKEMLDCFREEVCKKQPESSDVTAEDVLSYLRDEMQDAKRSIAYWEQHPRDINARFFKREYDKCDWEAIAAG